MKKRGILTNELLKWIIIIIAIIMIAGILVLSNPSKVFGFLPGFGNTGDRDEKIYYDFVLAYNSNQEKIITEKEQQYDEIIEKIAEELDINSNLIRAIIAQESNWNTNAISSHGARGLMQIMPNTENSLREEKECKTYCPRASESTDIFNPEHNIYLGSCYFKCLYFGAGNKDIQLTLAAYNWGQGKVRENCQGTWESCKNVRKETLEYVPKVIAYYEKYSGTVYA